MSILNETLWKDIPTFKNYQAHPEGEVRNKTTKRLFTTVSKKHTYISLNFEGKTTAKHRLIDCTSDVVKNIKGTNPSSISVSLKYNKTFSGGWNWEYASYDDIINPKNSYKKIIHENVKKALYIDENVNIKPEIVSLLRENISSDGKLNIKVRPVVQLNLNNTIVKYWSGPAIATRTLGYGINQIEPCLYGKGNTSNGYKWRYLTLEEIIICSKE